MSRISTPYSGQGLRAGAARSAYVMTYKPNVCPQEKRGGAARFPVWAGSGRSVERTGPMEKRASALAAPQVAGN